MAIAHTECATLCETIAVSLTDDLTNKGEALCRKYKK